MSGSNLVSNGLTILSGIIVARWLLPEELGLFNGFTIVTSYIIISQLGIPSGLSRELPLYFGKGDLEQARKFAAVAQYWQLILAVLVLVVSILTALVFFIMNRFEYAAGSIVIGITAFQTLYVTKYLKVLFRTNHDFNKLSKITLINAGASFLSIFFVWKFGFYGLCIRSLILACVDYYFTWRWKPLSVSPTWDVSVFRELSRIGLPMYAVANVYSLWPVIQKTLIAALGGVKALGLFAIAIVVESSMKSVTNALSSVVYPAMTTQWGKGATVAKLMNLTIKPVTLIIVLFLVAVPIGWWLLPKVVDFFLPNYIESVPAAQWMLLVGFIEVFNILPNVYNVIRKQRDRLLSFVAGISLWALTVTTLYFIRGFDLIIFPQAMLLAFVGMLLLNSWHIYLYRKYTIHTI